MPPDPENAVEEPTWQFFNPVPRGPLPTVPQEAPKPEIELTIDGKETSVPAGTTLLQAAQSLDIETPTLCYLENLTPVNVCRVCVVELEGSRTLVPACSREKLSRACRYRPTLPVSGLSRRMVLEFLSSSVDVSTAPELQQFMEQYEARPERYGPPGPSTAAEERDSAVPGHHADPE